MAHRQSKLQICIAVREYQQTSALKFYRNKPIFVPTRCQKVLAQMKYLTLIACMVAVTGCTPVSKRSVYSSGWSDDRSGAMFRMCAPYHLQKNMPIEPNLELLVAHGLLTPDQAQRARNADVQVGDPECLAYAAYGLSTGPVTFLRRTNKDGVIYKDITYWCSNSQAPCPGVIVTVADGKVTNIRRANPDDKPKPPAIFR